MLPGALVNVFVTVSVMTACGTILQAGEWYTFWENRIASTIVDWQMFQPGIWRLVSVTSPIGLRAFISL